MDKQLPHLFAFFSALCLCVPAYTADGGEWGVGTPTQRGKAPQRDWTGTSAATSSAHSPLSSSSSWGSAPDLNRDQPEVDRLRRENEDLRRSLAQNAAAPATASREEPFDPYAQPALSFRWISLLNGYPDPTSTNYDTRTRQYYDPSIGSFPSRQPPSSGLKNQIGTEVKAWELQVRTNRESYIAAYRDWQHKKNRYSRKLGEDVGRTLQQLETLTDSLFLDPQDARKSSIGESGKEAKNAEILQRAKIDAEHAEHTFKKLQRLLVALHPTECQAIGDERRLIFLTADDLEKRFIWGFIEKPLVTPYKTLPGQRHDPNNIKGLLLTDPVDIRIGIHMLSWMVLHLEREYGILADIRTRYKRDFVPKVTGLFSPTTWSDWYYSTSAGVLKDELKRDYPSSSIARFPEPKTDQEETLRLLRRDNLGLKLRSKYLDHIKHYQEIEGHDLSGSFLKIYQGLDHVSNVDRQTTHTINKFGEQRTFPKPLSTPLLSIQMRLQTDPLDEDYLFPDAAVPFTIPKKAQMVTEYISPKAMGFHRNLWPSVMRELLAQQGTALKPPSFGLGGATEYARLYGQYESAVQNIRLYLKPLQTADSFSTPTPFEFFFTAPPPPKQLAPEMVLDLEELGITDRDLSNLRLLPGTRSEPVLYRYAKIGLARNTLRFPDPTAFGPSLTSLDVSQNQLNNLEFAVPLTELTELDVSDQTLLNNLSPFGNEGVAPLPKLERFILAHTGLGQIGPLASFSSLRILDLSRNDLVTVAPLKDLKTLEELTLAQNRITDIADLESLYNLRKLDVSGNPVKDLKSIVKLEALQLLTANQCNLNGSWLTFLPVATNDADPRPKALTHLLLKGNEKLEWTPYQAKRSYSSSDVSSNNLAFNTSFPALQVLEVGANARLETTADKPITLSRLESKRF